MAFNTDILQVNPAETGVRQILSEAVTGKLQFIDPNASLGVTLDQIAGISVDDVYIVASGGAGAVYNTITEAMVAVRASSGTEHLIMVFPGIYSETATVLLDRTNLTIKALGEVSVLNVANVPVFTISDGTEVPTRVVMENLHISSSAAGISGVLISGGNGSTVGLDGISLNGCDWETSGTARAIEATEVDHICINGGSMKDCAGTGNKVVVTTCSSFTMNGVANAAAIQLDYTDVGNEPSDSATPKYKVKSSTLAGVTSTLTNKGVLDIFGCDGVFPVTFRGTQAGKFVGTQMGAVAVRDTSEVVFSGSVYTSLANDATVEITEAILIGTDTLAGASTTKTVTLPYVEPDTGYAVLIDMTSGPLVASGTTTKTTTTFIAEFATSDLGSRGFDWTLTRVVKA